MKSARRHASLARLFPVDEIDLGYAIGFDLGRARVVALGFVGAEEEAIRIAVVVGDASGARRAVGTGLEIGRASCRERV